MALKPWMQQAPPSTPSSLNFEPHTLIPEPQPRKGISLNP